MKVSTADGLAAVIGLAAGLTGIVLIILYSVHRPVNMTIGVVACILLYVSISTTLIRVLTNR